MAKATKTKPKTRTAKKATSQSFSSIKTALAAAEPSLGDSDRAHSGRSGAKVDHGSIKYDYSSSLPNPFIDGGD